MKHLDLFSGIGGFALAAQWCWGNEHKIVAFCEKESFAQKVLKKHWPDVNIFDDIKELKGDTLGQIDLLTAGVPCQPASCAGKRAGKEDDRWLWPETFRIIRETKPSWCILENVRGLLTLESGMVFEQLLSEVEAFGYEVQAFIIPACAVNAPHRRDRVWIVCNANNKSESSSPLDAKMEKLPTDIITDTRLLRPAEHEKQTTGIKQCSWWKVEPNVGRVANGIPGRVDRLKGLGNAIVPQVALEIMKGIKKGANP